MRGRRLFTWLLVSFEFWAKWMYCLCKKNKIQRVCLAYTGRVREDCFQTMGSSQTQTPHWASIYWSFKPLDWPNPSLSGDILAHIDLENEKNGLTYMSTIWSVTFLALMSFSWTWRLTHWVLFVEMPIFTVTSPCTWYPSMLTTGPARLWRARCRWNQTWL